MGRGGGFRGRGGRGGGRGGGGGGGRGGRDSWVQKDLSKPHPGSIPIEDIKSSAEWQDRFESDAPKRKYALCVSYLGSKYQGLQINPDAITVECLLEKALLLAGGMPEVNFGNLQKLQWSRAARTDRGVHAVSQCCSMKLTMPLDMDGREVFRSRVNRFLPEDIRLLAITKVSKNFSAKNACTRRTYQYYMPTYMLKSHEEMSAILQGALTEQGPLLDAGRAGGYAEPGSTQYLGLPHLGSVRDSLVPFRATSEQIEKLRATLKLYEGTNPYHNFTTGKSPNDANSKRFMSYFECSDPTIDPDTGVEWVVLSVLGQSFLLNQIRKMVGFAVDIVRGATTPDKVGVAFSSQRLDVPMAPGQGLFLDELFFDGYNIKIEHSNEKARLMGEKRAGAAAEGHSATKAKLEISTGDVAVGATEGSVLPDTTPGDVNAEAEVDINAEPDAGADEEDALFFHETLHWSTTSADVLRHFRQSTLLPHIRSIESSDKPFLFYLDHLRVHPPQYVPSEFPVFWSSKDKRDSREDDDE